MTAYTPPEARGAYSPDLLTDPGWCAEPKYNGHRATLRIRSDGRARMQTRTGREIIDRLPQFSGRYADLTDSIIDGELIAANGEHSGDVSRVVGSKPDRAIRLQSSGCWLRFMAFGLPRLHGADRLDLPERIYRAELVTLFGCELAGHPWVQLAPRAETTADKLDLERVEIDHREGIMLKRLDSPPGGGGWVKRKRRASFDCVVLGVNPATPGTLWADAGLIGSLRLGQWARAEHLLPARVLHVGDCSGFDMATRRAISADPDGYLDRVVEIVGQDRTPGGKILHPRFVRWRDDKPATGCVIEGGESC